MYVTKKPDPHDGRKAHISLVLITIANRIFRAIPRGLEAMVLAIDEGIERLRMLREQIATETKFADRESEIAQLPRRVEAPDTDPPSTQRSAGATPRRRSDQSQTRLKKGRRKTRRGA